MQSIVEKLQKMIEHEKSARSIGNLHEAEAFAGKIAEMLFAHKLTMAEVEISEGQTEEPVDSEMVDGLSAPWAGVIAMGVSTATFTRVLKSGRGYIFIGPFTDRNTAITMFRYLAVLGNSLADTELEKYKQSDHFAYESIGRPKIARTWKVSFLRGYANAIYSRLESEKKQLTAKAQSTNETGLIYINKGLERVDAFVRQKYGKTTKRYASTSNIHSGAYASGKAAGNAVSLKSQHALN